MSLEMLAIGLMCGGAIGFLAGCRGASKAVTGWQTAAVNWQQAAQQIQGFADQRDAAQCHHIALLEERREQQQAPAPFQMPKQIQIWPPQV